MDNELRGYKPYDWITPDDNVDERYPSYFTDKKYFLISCSFREILKNFYIGALSYRVGAPPTKILDLPRF